MYTNAIVPATVRTRALGAGTGMSAVATGMSAVVAGLGVRKGAPAADAAFAPGDPSAWSPPV